MLVRGADRWNYFDHEDGAAGEFLPSDLDASCTITGAARGLRRTRPPKAS